MVTQIVSFSSSSAASISSSISSAGNNRSTTSRFLKSNSNSLVPSSKLSLPKLTLSLKPSVQKKNSVEKLPPLKHLPTAKESKSSKETPIVLPHPKLVLKLQSKPPPASVSNTTNESQTGNVPQTQSLSISNKNSSILPSHAVETISVPKRIKISLKSASVPNPSSEIVNPQALTDSAAFEDKPSVLKTKKVSSHPDVSGQSVERSKTASNFHDSQGQDIMTSESSLPSSTSSTPLPTSSSFKVKLTLKK